MKPGAEANPTRPLSHRPRVWWPWLLLASLTITQVAASPEPEAEPFERMRQALSNLNYSGVLVYSHDNRMETLRIVQRVTNGRVQAELESLNGPPRGMKQDGGQVTCRLSGEHLIAVAQRALGQEGQDGKPLKARDLAPYYLVQSQGQARVADRQTQVLGIIPSDALRYGYRFFLDTQTGLPLKLDLIGGDARTLEQLMFTSLTLDPATPATEAEVSPMEAGDSAAFTPPDNLAWTFDGLPPGFELVRAERTLDASGRPLEHLVLSDGLAAISIYAEESAAEGLQGGSRIGAIHAHGGKVAGHQVTVVGEAPAATVAAVFSAVQRQEGVTP
ncbi:MAG: MucB/RseB C-terminal domain-containing protein [Chromatiaceae bacterium]